MTISLPAALMILAHFVAFGHATDRALGLNTNTSSIVVPLVACHAAEVALGSNALDRPAN